jgi:hypothetical protein
MLLASSSVLATAVKVLPDFIRSRRSGFRIEVTVKGDETSVTFDAQNADQKLIELVARLLDE